MSTRTLASASTKARSMPATRLPCFVFESSDDLARYVAAAVATIIRERNALGQNAVLALPTGSTPTGVYRELIRLHREEGLDFSGVVVFVLDEYYPLRPEEPQSHHRWMRRHFIDHVNILPENFHVPDGTVPPDQLEAHCRDFEATIDDAGGIDLVLLGIGTNGHIGFNEPFGVHNSRTQLCTLDPATRRAAASMFFNVENVAVQAITMGLATILEARKVFLLALGEHKAKIIREAVEGEPTDRVPASFLQEHGDAAALVDTAAGKELTGLMTPWVLGQITWKEPLIKRALFWLCEQTGKALLKLDDDDFRNHGLHQLLREEDSATQLAHRVFRWMMNTIEYHPAGKDPRKIICFSPHPDDDVISMGGTLLRLVSDGHEVHVAYMTSGNIAVFDHDAKRVADLVTEYNRLFEVEDETARQVEAAVQAAIENKNLGQADVDAVRKIKGLIRWSEAKAAAAEVGCLEKYLHFLDLPFYRTGTIAKNPVGEEDVRIIRELIEAEQPEQIYVAGDLSDPHDTHRVCAEAVFRALEEIEAAGGRVPEVLLYRGAWQEYDLFEIEIAVPLSPENLARKRQAIFMHESQKDRAAFPGSDPREFWQRAEDRNKGTADRYNQIGLPEYYALEAFVRWRGGRI